MPQRARRIAAGLSSAGVAAWLSCAAPPREPAADPEPAAEPGAAVDPSQNRRTIRLLFAAEDSGLLAAQDHTIFRTHSLTSQAKQVVWALIQGPKSDGGSPLPPGTRLREVYLAQGGTLYVDFTREIQANHAGGSRGEIETIYALVDTLALNFPEVRRVQLLVEGREIDTLAGHLDLSRPLVPDWQWVEPQSRPPSPG
ncbi:MAG TPA: GerMN domain-containing protein [Acidobacteriota bacterium]